ncbi:hypothetical protein E2I00_016396 [Balaenoptera physalus]|uniref:Uncharacterized protein n=1 Tax=Balaenoptera physalus TaxID=9770 RepID=A0A643C4U5_BALPH|nr:hypothetical protein E2I00_016396 [Balaenoptera physalus]
MDTLAPVQWRRQRPEELQIPGNWKRACGRLEAAAQEQGCPQVKTSTLESWSREEHQGQTVARGDQVWGFFGSAFLQMHCGGIWTF